MAKKKTLDEQAAEILKIAESHGVQSNYFFVTTFNRYQTQIHILADLEKKINEEGTLVTKEYVRGRGNLYAHPAVAEYNKTSTAANQTVKTLIDIVKTLRPEDENEGENLKDMMSELMADD